MVKRMSKRWQIWASRGSYSTIKDEVEIEKFLQAQKSKNTQYKTKSDLNAWKKFCIWRGILQLLLVVEALTWFSSGVENFAGSR